MDLETFSLTWAERDWWPLTRLLTVALTFGLLAHWKLGWNPVVHDLWKFPGGVATIFLAIVAVSSSLAHVVLVVVSIPLCGIILLNDWLYDSSAMAFRLIIRTRSSPAIALAGLLGELLLFAALAFLLWRLLN